MKNKLWWVMMVIIWGVFVIIGIKNLDPDFGWHIRIGEIMSEKGIVTTDPFSYTMPSFPWVDHGRWSDLAIAWVYPRFGMAGLAIIFATIGVGAIMLVLPKSMINFGIVPLLLGWGILGSRFGIRPQVEDWFFLGILIRLLYNQKLWNRWKWWIPGMFIIWANCHGGFMVGLGVLLVLIWGNKKENWVIWILAGLGTAINAYGFRLWWEIWLTVSDISLRSRIMEWQPFYTRAELGIWLFTGLTGALVKLYVTEVEKKKLIVGGVLLAAGMTSLRNMPFYFLAGLPLTAELMKRVYEYVRTEPTMWKRAKIFYAVVVAIAVVIVAVDVAAPTIQSIRRESLVYPEKAVDFLKEYPFNDGKLFSDYGWGGYLIWKLPEQKVFIDGRMPSWRFKAPVGESDNAFADYIEIVGEGKYQKLFEKFDIKMVLWPKGGSILAQNSSGIDLGKWKWLKSWRGPEITINFIDNLVKDGWKKIYEDDVTEIFISPPSTNLQKTDWLQIKPG